MFRIVFSAFIFLYFALAQADVIAYLCSIVRGLPVVPYPWLAAMVLTVVFMFLCSRLERLLVRKSVCGLWAYVLMSWLAAFVVSLPFATPVYQLMLAVAALMSGWLLIRWKQYLSRNDKHTATLWSQFMPAAVELMVLCLYMGIGAAATDLEHFELRSAQSLQCGNPDEVQTIGQKSYVTSHRLFALRCYALSCSASKGLGHHIFAQPVPAGNSSNLLFPDDERQQLTFPCANQEQLLGGKARAGEAVLDYLKRSAYAAHKSGYSHARWVADYYLCGLLLERKLDLFAHEIAFFYSAEVASRSLPTYYAQALVFYTRTRMHPVLVYHDAAVEANFHDYLTLRDSYSHPVERANRLRRTYGDTYWWWYTYSK